MVNRVHLWLRSLVLRRRLEREMQEEMAWHLEQATARLITRGLSPAEARRAARREFGNVAVLQEAARDARGATWLDSLNADVRFALRHFARTPGTTTVMFVVLAAGLTLSTLLFTFVHAYAHRPPPGIRLEDDLVRIRGSRDAGAAGRGYRHFDEEELLEYRKLTDHFESVAGWTDANVTFALGDDPERRKRDTRVFLVTENYFSVLGVQPALGPGLPRHVPDDPATASVAVISYFLWVELFARSPNAIGSTLIVNDVPVTIVGVAPEPFTGFPAFSRFQLWMPLASRHLIAPGPAGEFRAAARLRKGVDARAATAATEAVAARTAASTPELRALDPAADVVPLLAANGDPMFERDVKLQRFAIGFLALLVLLITCTNVSALLTGLATARRQEIAIRLSLGAARARLIRQLLTESALLATLAGASALGTVWLVLRTVMMRIPGMPFEVGITWPATTFVFGTALAVGVLFGLSPALHATRLAIASVLRDSAGTVVAARARLQRALVVAQIALTQPLIVLLAAVLLFVLVQMQPNRPTELGDRLLSVSLRPAVELEGSSPAALESRRQLRDATHRLLERLEASPGIAAAAIEWRWSDALGSWVVHRDDRIEGASSDAFSLLGVESAPDWLDVMGFRLVRGRTFEPTETSARAPGDNRSPVIIGADLARRLWAGAEPIGRRLQPASDTAGDPRTLVVVGVIDDPQAKTRRAGQDFRVFLPPDTSRTPWRLMLRTTGAAQTLVPSLREVAREEVPGAVVDFRTLAQIEEGHRRNFRLVTGGLSAAGLAALFLSAIGLYAVVAFAVGQRTKEIALRMAVGARGRQIVGRFVGDGLRLSAIGLVLGLPISVLGLNQLMGLSPDIPRVPLPAVTAVAAVGIVLVAAAAAWIPARRAAAVDPAVTLRHD